MNGYLWHIAFINPGSAKLVDRTGVSTLATTDPTVMRIYISDVLSGQELETVLIHELGMLLCFLTGFCLIFTKLLNDSIGWKLKNGCAIS